MNQNLTVSFITVVDDILPSGQSHQMLASIDVFNTSDSPVTLTGNAEELGAQLGVVITDVMPDAVGPLVLEFLYQGDHDSQLDLSMTPQKIRVDEARTVQVRLVDPPGISGHFVLHAGVEEHTIQIV